MLIKVERIKKALVITVLITLTINIILLINKYIITENLWLPASLHRGLPVYCNFVGKNPFF